MSIIEDLKNSVTKEFCFSNKSETDDVKLNIGFGIDAVYARPMGVAIASIAANSPDISLVFHVFESSIEKEDIQRLKELTENNKNISINIYHVDVQVISHLPTLKHLTLATYFRFMLPLVLETESRILYLDSDIVCLSSLSELIDVNLNKYTCAVVEDADYMQNEKVPEFKLNGPYFNAGVMLINVLNWNKNNVSEKAIELLTSSNKIFSFLDQDVLNIILEGKVLYLPRKWNCLHAMFDDNKDTAFLHCTFGPKPWKITCNHSLQSYYLRYEKKSPWKDEPLVLPTTYREARLYANLLLRKHCISKALSWYVKYLGMKTQAKFKY